MILFGKAEQKTLFFYVTTSQKAVQQIDIIAPQADERDKIYGLYHYIFRGDNFLYITVYATDAAYLYFIFCRAKQG